MNRAILLAASFAVLTVGAKADEPSKTDKYEIPSGPTFFQPTESKSTGTVTAAGQTVSYDAVAGTLVVHAQDYDPTAPKSDEKNPDAEASMFYTAYFKHGSTPRPIVFLFNGGPGSSSIWVQMGAFGPRRVLTNDGSHTPGAPYKLIDNPQSLLDTADLVFIDAPGTGFSRIAGKDAVKEFYGVDQDAHAFAEFIRSFLGKYNRWNSPKYVFGESYGTMRAVVLARMLQEMDIDLNGVVLLSDILNWDLMPDDPEVNPTIDAPYIVTLPTYAATAWYHHVLPKQPQTLRPFLEQVEKFATGEYAQALMRGNLLSWDRKKAVAAKLHAFTGLSVAYLLKTNLRIEYGAFQKELMAQKGQTTGTLDTRFAGPTLDPLSKISEYDPQSAAISSAYVAAFNSYVRDTLHYDGKQAFKPGIEIYGSWDYKHQPPGANHALIALPNVLPDLASTMKQNPTLKVLVNGGYFDVSTPYYAGWFEMHHLQIPPKLQGNIQFHYYESGHMVYVHDPARVELHDTVAGFIRASDNLQ